MNLCVFISAEQTRQGAVSGLRAKLKTMGCWCQPGRVGVNSGGLLGVNNTALQSGFQRMLPTWGEAENATAISAGNFFTVVLAGVPSSSFFFRGTSRTFRESPKFCGWRVGGSEGLKEVGFDVSRAVRHRQLTQRHPPQLGGRVPTGHRLRCWWQSSRAAYHPTQPPLRNLVKTPDLAGMLDAPSMPLWLLGVVVRWIVPNGGIQSRASPPVRRHPDPHPDTDSDGHPQPHRQPQPHRHRHGLHVLHTDRHSHRWLCPEHPHTEPLPKPTMAKSTFCVFSDSEKNCHRFLGVSSFYSPSFFTQFSGELILS